MRNPKNVLNNLVKHSNVSGYKFERLYRILFNEQMFYTAYQRIYAKQGNMTAGTDGKTVDEMSIQRIENLISKLRDESYKPNPAKRVYIPKKNGKKRPLGIPSFEDKLVQEVVHMILEAIYEGSFENTSHGFRPRRSCQTALTQIQDTFLGTKWFIEGDIKGFFDNIDHNVLIGILEERIADERFIRLIRKFLKIGNTDTRTVELRKAASLVPYWLIFTLTSSTSTWRNTPNLSIKAQAEDWIRITVGLKTVRTSWKRN